MKKKIFVFIIFFVFLCMFSMNNKKVYASDKNIDHANESLDNFDNEAIKMQDMLTTSETRSNSDGTDYSDTIKNILLYLNDNYSDYTWYQGKIC